jgi:hypothetical protein
MTGISYWSVQAAVADSLYRQNTPESLQASVVLAPGNALSHRLMAEHLEGMGRDPDGEFAAAAKLSPRDSQFWIRLAFRAEVEGNYTLAEKYLMRAVAVDRMFNPRWALMNYYFRRGSADPFWSWSERALGMSHGDTTPLFRLWWEETQDEDLIEKHLTENRDIRVKYLSFLAVNNRLDRAGKLARQIAQFVDRPDVPRLVDYCERMATGDSPSAVAVWNTLSARKLIPYTPLDPAKGVIVTNGDFAIQGTPQGFDWRFPAFDGVSIAPAADSTGIVLRMSGSEPEDCTPLLQTIPVVPGARYRISWEYQLPDTPDAEGISGLKWEVADATGSRESFGQSAELTRQGRWKTGELVFESGPRSSVNLLLHYKRPFAATRAEGSVTIRLVKSEATSKIIR